MAQRSSPGSGSMKTLSRWRRQTTHCGGSTRLRAQAEAFAPSAAAHCSSGPTTILASCTSSGPRFIPNSSSNLPQMPSSARARLGQPASTLFHPKPSPVGVIRAVSQVMKARADLSPEPMHSGGPSAASGASLLARDVHPHSFVFLSAGAGMVIAIMVLRAVFGHRLENAA